MKTASKGKRTNITLALFCAIAMMSIISETAFMRFWHYDSQYRQLNPEHYNVKVITEEDHEQLANPENRTVKLSNGTTITKGDVLESRILKNYKPVNNGSQYALVTIRGTAPFMHKWYENILPLLIFSIIGLLWGLKHKRVQEANKDA
ncbi:MAG: hypothetical protein FVQ82_15145 [Planctomycetes bacterium]|nr:hypothetical protein [Planctomycetota bacterium]